MKTTLLSLATALLLTTATFAAPAPGHDDNRRPGLDRRDDRNDKDFNYGFDKKHRVTPQEKARWEAAHRNDRHDNDSGYGYDKNRPITAQQARWEAAHRNDRQNDSHRDDTYANYGYDRNHKVTAQEKARWEAAHHNTRR